MHYAIETTICELLLLRRRLAQVLLTEVAPNLSRFPTETAFCSWLRLCPDPKVSGDQVLSSRTRLTKNRVVLALRLATQGLRQTYIVQVA
jgi:hypothetical protein